MSPLLLNSTAAFLSLRTTASSPRVRAVSKHNIGVVVWALASLSVQSTPARSTFHPTFSGAPEKRHGGGSLCKQRSFTSMSTQSPRFWQDASTTAISKCIPPLSENSYKGSSGRVGVLGGSTRYTGAPYYAAMASLKVGADLAFVFCAQEAAGPIKGYSPELMVAPVYRAEDFDRIVREAGQENEEGPQWESNASADPLIDQMVHEVVDLMDKMHVLVIGPGLGRCPMVLEATSRIIRSAQDRQLPLVLDADALYLFTMEQYHDLLNNSQSTMVLTPNAMEWKRLQGKAADKIQANEKIWVVKKGKVDLIECARSDSESMECHEQGGLKRSGGLGDVLAGSLGTLVAWNGILEKQGVASAADMSLAAWTACCFVKRATRHAFKHHRRAMTAPDVLQALGSVVDEMTNDGAV